MDNQHRKISGYRELSESEIHQINQIKEQGKALDKLIIDLQINEGLDKRWMAIGVTRLQEGLMALTRAVAKPDFF